MLKGFPADVVDAVLVDLAGDGLQSDARFAEVFLRSRAGKGYGVYRIRQELRQRGIGENEGPDWRDVDWDDLIWQVYTRKYRDETFPPSPQERAARERFLMRRGFTGDQIRRLFRRLRDGGE